MKKKHQAYSTYLMKSVMMMVVVVAARGDGMERGQRTLVVKRKKERKEKTTKIGIKITNGSYNIYDVTSH